jgi:uncharacterized membrane protein
MNKTLWSQQTKKIFNGILLFSIAWIAYGIFEPIESLFSGIGTLASFSGASDPTGGAGTALSIITYLLLIGIGLGYILTIVGLGNFGNILDEADKKAVGSVRTAFILALIAVVLDFLPLPGIIGGIVYLIAVILMLVGYGKLKKSSSFPGGKGASTLFVAMILIVVGWVLDFIPLIGDWMEALLTIIAYIMTLVGWNKIKNAAV